VKLQAFEDLPDAKGVEFTMVPHVPLAPLLPNLPPDPSPPPTAPAPTSERQHEAVLDPVHFPQEEMTPSPLDLISRFLVYPSENRLRAARALEHPWFTGEGVLIPEGYEMHLESGMGAKTETVMEMEGRSLGYWVRQMLGRGEE